MQRDAMQCGVASLCMVANYYGLNRKLSWFEHDCRPTAEGVSMKAIKYSALKAGMDAVGVSVTTERLCELPMPSILHWDQSHFVVLYRTSRQGRWFHVADPAKGKTKYTREEFENHWISTQKNGTAKGIALLLQPGEGFEKQKKDSEQSGKSLKFLMGYFRKYRKHFLLILLGLLAGCLLQLIFPFLTQAIVDVGIKNANIGFIWLVLLGELMIVAGQTVIGFVRRWLLLHISMRINVSLVSDFLIKLLKLPMSFFRYKITGRPHAENRRSFKSAEFFNRASAQSAFYFAEFYGVWRCAFHLQQADIFYLYSRQCGIRLVDIHVSSSEKGA